MLRLINLCLQRWLLGGGEVGQQIESHCTDVSERADSAVYELQRRAFWPGRSLSADRLYSTGASVLVRYCRKQRVQEKRRVEKQVA